VLFRRVAASMSESNLLYDGITYLLDLNTTVLDMCLLQVEGNVAVKNNNNALKSDQYTSRGYHVLIMCHV